MEFDYILLDILDWVRRLLWWQRQKKVEQKPYELLKLERGQQGVLKLVRRDTPRAVRTWIFTPYRRGEIPLKQRLFDLHLYLDHLYPLTEADAGWLPKPTRRGSKKKAERRVLTHRVTILEASHFLSKEGTYNSFTIFCESYDFLGTAPGGYRDRCAVPAIDDVARLLKVKPAAQIDWRFEIETSRRLYLGTHWTPSYSRDRLVMKQLHNHATIGMECLIQTTTHPGASEFSGRSGVIKSAWQAEDTLMFTVEVTGGARIDGLFLSELFNLRGEPIRFH